MDNLLDFLRRGVKPDPAFVVVEALPAISREEPARAVETLRRLLEVERAGWSFDSWNDEIQQVLRTALDSGDPEASTLAEDTTHWLGALGHRQFRALLD